jgi:hypothetical protein
VHRARPARPPPAPRTAKFDQESRLDLVAEGVRLGSKSCIEAVGFLGQSAQETWTLRHFSQSCGSDSCGVFLPLGERGEQYHETGAIYSAGSKSSPWSHADFAVLWTATVIANISTWMCNAASAWLITSPNPDSFVVSMVQVATTLPIFLFANPARARIKTNGSSRLSGGSTASRRIRGGNLDKVVSH